MDARRALLSHLFDYAGMFPPAQLPLEEAIAEWRGLRASDDAWLLNRFAVRAGVDVDVEPLAVVEGQTERQSDVVYIEGETKLRCGGARIPSADEVAQFVRRCRAEGRRFKATAGLHHALPTDGEHGFLNLLAATAAPPGRLDAVLAEEDAAELDVAAGDRSLFTSFGSCSWREPVEDLVELGLLS